MKVPETAASNVSQQLTAEAALKLLFPDAGILSQAERLRLTAEGRIRGTLAGKRRSSQLGGSQEFADYRPYVPGDDIRRIDWNVYGRTGRAYMRQYWDEQELQLQLYIDMSRSMQFGQGESNKLAYALRLAAAVGFATLCGEDRVAVHLYSTMIEQQLPLLRGRASSSKLFQFLAEALLLRSEQVENPPYGQEWQSSQQSSGLQTSQQSNQQRLQSSQQSSQSLSFQPSDNNVVSNMAAPFMQPGALPRRSGVTWLLTDALFEEGIEQTLLSFIAARQKVVLIHVMSPEELDPTLSGELRLIDSELRSGKEVAVGHKLLSDYRAAAAAYQTELKQLCAERGVDYLFVNTALPLQDTLSSLQMIGALKH